LLLFVISKYPIFSLCAVHIFYEIALKELEKDWQALFIKIPLTEEIAESAAALATQHPLKGADAAHLATAMSAGASLFVASDQELMRASNKAGLEAYDPSKGPFR
jgi:predicted nucleic acid-binding protein